LPTLSCFLESLGSFDTNTSLEARLDLVRAYIQKVLAEDDFYHEYLKLMIGSNNDFGLAKEDVVEGEIELDLHIKESQEKLHQTIYGDKRVKNPPEVT